MKTTKRKITIHGSPSDNVPSGFIQTKSPKIKKVTSTYDKQWEEIELPDSEATDTIGTLPVNRITKSKKLPKNIKSLNKLPALKTHGQKYSFGLPIDMPDSEATVEQIKSWVKFSIKNNDAFLSTKGNVTVQNIKSYLKDGILCVVGKPPKTNYWKYACIAILLGVVVSMIIFTMNYDFLAGYIFAMLIVWVQGGFK